MNKQIRFLLLTAIILILIACGGGGEAARSVAEEADPSPSVSNVSTCELGFGRLDNCTLG